MAVFKFRVFRYRAEAGKDPHFDEYSLELPPGATVLDGLHGIAREHDAVAYRCSCRSGLCGSCAMEINGEIRLACKTQVAALGSPGVTVSPLPGLPVLKDLVVDLDPFLGFYQELKPWLENDQGLKQVQLTQKNSQAAEALDECMLCAACYAACPAKRRNTGYYGPAAMSQSYRFMLDPRDEAYDQRIKAIDSFEGVWGCDGVMRCVEVCPKGLKPRDVITDQRKRAIAKKIAGLLGTA